jgi:hypothetical protein
MTKAPIFKTVHPERRDDIERIKVKVICIDPRLSFFELLKKFYEAEKNKKCKLISIKYMSSPLMEAGERVNFGEDNIFQIEVYNNVVFIRPKTLKCIKEGTLKKFLNAYEEFEESYIKTDHKAVPNSRGDIMIYYDDITLLDMGSSPNYAQTIIKFKKERKIDKKSPVGELLSGAQIMPVDSVMIYPAEIDKKTGKYKKGEIPAGIKENITHYEAGQYVLEDVYVNQYTRNIYQSDFTVQRNCEVGKETKLFDRFSPIDGGACELSEKRFL